MLGHSKVTSLIPKLFLIKKKKLLIKKKMDSYRELSGEKCEVSEPNPLDIPNLRNASLNTLEHGHRENIRSFQRFISDHNRVDEAMELTNEYLKAGNDMNQSEMVDKESLTSREFGCRRRN